MGFFVAATVLVSFNILVIEVAHVESINTVKISPDKLCRQVFVDQGIECD